MHRRDPIAIRSLLKGITMLFMLAGCAASPFYDAELGVKYAIEHGQYERLRKIYERDGTPTETREKALAGYSNLLRRRSIPDSQLIHWYLNTDDHGLQQAIGENISVNSASRVGQAFASKICEHRITNNLSESDWKRCMSEDQLGTTELIAKKLQNDIANKSQISSRSQDVAIQALGARATPFIIYELMRVKQDTLEKLQRLTQLVPVSNEYAEELIPFLFDHSYQHRATAETIITKSHWQDLSDKTRASLCVVRKEAEQLSDAPRFGDCVRFGADALTSLELAINHRRRLPTEISREALRALGSIRDPQIVAIAQPFITHDLFGSVAVAAISEAGFLGKVMTDSQSKIDVWISQGNVEEILRNWSWTEPLLRENALEGTTTQRTRSVRVQVKMQSTELLGYAARLLSGTSRKSVAEIFLASCEASLNRIAMDWVARNDATIIPIGPGCSTVRSWNSE